MGKVLLAVFDETDDVVRSLNGAVSVEVLECPAGVDDLAALDAQYDAVLVVFDATDYPWEERAAHGLAIDFVNLNLAHRLKGGCRPVWL